MPGRAGPPSQPQQRTATTVTTHRISGGFHQLGSWEKTSPGTLKPAEIIIGTSRRHFNTIIMVPMRMRRKRSSGPSIGCSFLLCVFLRMLAPPAGRLRVLRWRLQSDHQRAVELLVETVIVVKVQTLRPTAENWQIHCSTCVTNTQGVSCFITTVL